MFAKKRREKSANAKWKHVCYGPTDHFSSKASSPCSRVNPGYPVNTGYPAYNKFRFVKGAKQGEMFTKNHEDKLD